jgi:hypothetical protein
MKKTLLAVSLLVLGAAVVGAQTTAPALTPEMTKVITNELTRFGKELALSEAQKTALKPILEKQLGQIKELASMAGLTDAQKLTKYKDIRAAGYDQIKQVLSPEQLVKWDAEAAKAKDFLGAKVLR